MTATIYAYTVIRTSAEAFQSRVPYAAAIVDIDGVRKAALIEGYADGMEIAIGQHVRYSHDDQAGNQVFCF